MTLREIVRRLRRLEQIVEIQCLIEDKYGDDRIMLHEMEDAIAKLRLDIERDLLKTEGTL